MALKAKLTKAEFDALAEPLKEHYKASGDDYILDAEGIEDVTGLKAALAAKTKERNDLKAKLEAEVERWKDLDPERARDAVKALAEIDDKKLVDKGEYDRILAKKTKEFEDREKGYQVTLAEQGKRLDTYELTNPIRDAALKAGVLAEDVDVVLAYTKGRFKLNEKRKVVVLDADGDETTMTPEKFFAEPFKVERPKFYAASGNGGSGASQTEGGTKSSGKVITLDEHQKMSAQESTQFFKEGGKVAA